MVEMDNAKTVLLKITKAFQEAVEEVGENGLPEGPLYATVCGMMGLETFQAIIGALVDTGKIKRDGFILRSCKL